MQEKHPPKPSDLPSLTPQDYQDMLMNAPVGVFSSTPEGCFLYLNVALAEIFGYASPQEMMASVKNVAKDLYADSKDRKKVLRLLEENKAVRNHECRFVRKNNTTFWASYSVRAVHNEKDGKLYYQGFLSDITERILEKEALLRTQFAMDRAPDNILWINSAGHIVYANHSSCNSLGYSRDELLSMKIFDIDPEFSPNQWEQHKEKRRRVGTMAFESRHITKDGRIFPVEIRSNHFEYNGDELSLTFDRDITERKRTEQALRESETRFRQLFKMAPTPMAHVSKDGRVLDVNDAFLDIIGYSTDDAPTLEQAWQLSFEDSDQKEIMSTKWQNELERALAENDDQIEAMECPVRCKDGNERRMIISTRVIEDRIILSFFDITAHHQAEAERKRLQEQLHQSQKLEAVGVLAGGVAHDFNNMLGTIMGYAELAINDTGPADPVRGKIEAILDAARRSASLTRQLLAFARKQTIEPVVFDLNTAVEGIMEMIRRLIGEHIELAWLPGDTPCTICMDPVQLDQILVNLCVNARDAIADIGRITIETNAVSFDADYCQTHAEFLPGDYVLLAVSDNGCGMANETLSNIFEPFFTTKGMGMGMGMGTGMGLSTVYGIVRQNQGFINVYSEPEKGTTFRIYLPRSAADSAEAKPQRTETIRKSRGETILIVEDEPMLLELGMMMLQQLGYSVIAAATPHEAIQAVRENAGEIQLFITDVVMPEMTGRDLAERLQEIRPD
ncbi:MAG: PAS domain S-box protein [Desulfobacteraceae bacterium]|nr:PAS domain S-box protein [Desulfobacteraceae bacterium]